MIKFAVVFTSDPLHPLLLFAYSYTEWTDKLRDASLKYGPFELIYRVG